MCPHGLPRPWSSLSVALNHDSTSGLLPFPQLSEGADDSILSSRQDKAWHLGSTS